MNQLLKTGIFNKQRKHFNEDFVMFSAKAMILFKKIAIYVRIAIFTRIRKKLIYSEPIDGCVLRLRLLRNHFLYDVLHKHLLEHFTGN